MQADSAVTPRKVRARLLLPVTALLDSARNPRAGELWRIEGSIDPFPGPRNPGEFDYGAYLSLAGVDAVIRAARASPGSADPPSDRHSWLGTMQSRLYCAIDALHSGERAAFLKGVILGFRADLGEELKQAFLMTGTVHILAVSGGNVALVAGVAMVLFGVLRFRRRTVWLLAIGAVVGYMWITGSSPSVVRATIMAIVVLAGGVVGRRTDVFQSLSVAALVLLLVDPRSLFDPGFQLSFVSVLAIVVGVPQFNRALERWPEEVRDQPQVRAIAQLMFVSLAAQVGTLPLTLGMFGQVSIVAVLANLAVVPLSGVSLILGVIELLLVPLVPWVAGVFATVNDQVMNALLGLVRAAAGIPWAAVETGRPGGVVVWGAYSFLGAVAAGAVPSARRSLIIFGLVFVNVSVWVPVFDHSPYKLDVLTLDVGQGDAHIIRTPSGKIVLIDTGPSEFAAERTILPAVKRLGARHLDVVVVTHAHRDHTGGLAWLLDHIPVRTLAVSDTSFLGPILLSGLRLKGGAVRVVQRGDRLEPDPAVRMYVVHPAQQRMDRSANNHSVAVRLVMGGKSMLFTGDMEAEAEEAAVDRYGSLLRSDVLKVAHHGSNTGTTDPWLSVVSPTQATISVGWGNSFGHPDPDRVAALRRMNIGVATTMTDGAIWWRTDGKSWKRIWWRS